MSAAEEELQPDKPEPAKKTCAFDQALLDKAVKDAEERVAQLSEDVEAWAAFGAEKVAKDFARGVKKREEHLARVMVARDNFKDIEERGEEKLLRQAQENLAEWKKEVDQKAKEEEEKEQEPVIQVHQGDWGEVTGRLTEEHGVEFLVLDMASAVDPGGGWLWGAAACEENMARRTNFAHNISSDEVDPKTGEYVQAQTDLINGKNGRVKYMPGLFCVRGAEVWTDGVVTGYEPLPDNKIFPFKVLCSAAINRRKAGWDEETGTPKPFSPDEKEETRARIAAQLDTAIEQGERNVVLLPFGCGAFNNPPPEVAALYREELEKRRGCFDRVHFAIFFAGHNPQNYEIFHRELDGRSLVPAEELEGQEEQEAKDLEDEDPKRALTKKDGGAWWVADTDSGEDSDYDERQLSPPPKRLSIFRGHFRGDGDDSSLAETSPESPVVFQNILERPKIKAKRRKKTPNPWKNPAKEPRPPAFPPPKRKERSDIISLPKKKEGPSDSIPPPLAGGGGSKSRRGGSIPWKSIGAFLALGLVISGLGVGILAAVAPSLLYMSVLATALSYGTLGVTGGIVAGTVALGLSLAVIGLVVWGVVSGRQSSKVKDARNYKDMDIELEKGQQGNLPLTRRLSASTSPTRGEVKDLREAGVLGKGQRPKRSM